MSFILIYLYLFYISYISTFKTASSLAVTEPVKIKRVRSCHFGPRFQIQPQWFCHVFVGLYTQSNGSLWVCAERKRSDVSAVPGKKVENKGNGFNAVVSVSYYWYWLFYLHNSATKKSIFMQILGAHPSVCPILLKKMGLSWLEQGPPVLSPMHAD